MSTLDDFSTAQRLDKIVETKVNAQLNKKRPAPRYAIVKEINTDQKYAMVSYVGEDSIVKIPYGSIAPENVGDAVRIEGIPGDRYISDVLGDTKLQILASDAKDAAGVAQNTAEDAQEAIEDVATNTQNQISTLQQIFLVRSNRPLWEGVDPTGETSFPYALLSDPLYHIHGGVSSGSGNTSGSGTSSIYLSNTSSSAACVRIESPNEKRQISFLASRSGAVSGFYLDVYKMNPNNGSFIRLHSTENLASELLTALSWQQVIIPPILFDMGDIAMIQFRATSNVNIVGVNLPAPPNILGFRPAQIGLFRNVSDAPGVISQSVADSSYSGLTPYFQFGSDVGQLNAPRSFFDNFNRGSLGNTWALFKSGGQDLFIESGRIAKPDFPLIAFRAGGVYTLPLATDDIAVEWDNISTESQSSGVILCSSSSFTNNMVVNVNTSYINFYTNTNIGVAGTLQARVNNPGSSDNRRFKATYTQSDNTYRMYFDASSDVPILEWTDSGNIISHGKGKRYCGVQIDSASFVRGSAIDNWNAYDID